MSAKQKIVIDADGLTMGKLAAFAAKQGLNGENVVIFNAEKALISGKPDAIFADMKTRFSAKSHTNPRRYGPKRPKNPDRFLRRVIRGMLPYTKPKGIEAFSKIMVYKGRPELTILKKEQVDLNKVTLQDTKGMVGHYDYFVTIGELCKYLGGKSE